MGKIIPEMTPQRKGTLRIVISTARAMRMKDFGVVEFTVADFDLTWMQLFNKYEPLKPLYEMLKGSENGYLIQDNRRAFSRKMWSLESSVRAYINSFKVTMKLYQATVTKRLEAVSMINIQHVPPVAAKAPAAQAPAQTHAKSPEASQRSDYTALHALIAAGPRASSPQPCTSAQARMMNGRPRSPQPGPSSEARPYLGSAKQVNGLPPKKRPAQESVRSSVVKFARGDGQEMQLIFGSPKKRPAPPPPPIISDAGRRDMELQASLTAYHAKRIGNMQPPLRPPGSAPMWEPPLPTPPPTPAETPNDNVFVDDSASMAPSFASQESQDSLADLPAGDVEDIHRQVCQSIVKHLNNAILLRMQHEVSSVLDRGRWMRVARHIPITAMALQLIFKKD